MRLRIVAAGNKMPQWVETATAQYMQRMPRECPIEIHPVSLAKRGRGADPARAIADEGQRMLGAIKARERVVAMEVGGRSYSTEALADAMQQWLNDGRDVAFLIGGPDGLAAQCLARADQQCSLSPLTLPHGLVRVILAEQLYRAWSLLKGHPYHRA